jgi:hypothetical protein
MPQDALTQISLHERRLAAALTRIANAVETAMAAAVAQPAAAPPEPGSPLESLWRENQRLRGANAELRVSLQALTDAAATGGPGPDQVERALRAEVEALRADRAAEVAELDGILAELKPLIAGADSHARA